MNVLGVAHGWALALLPLAALPLLRLPSAAIPCSWLGLVPEDPVSRWLDRALRAAGVLTIASLVLAASGLHRPAYEVERIGRGAHMVLLVDRSTSMDRPLRHAGDRSTRRRRAGASPREKWRAGSSPSSSPGGTTICSGWWCSARSRYRCLGSPITTRW